MEFLPGGRKSLVDLIGQHLVDSILPSLLNQPITLLVLDQHPTNDKMDPEYAVTFPGLQVISPRPHTCEKFTEGFGYNH